MPALAPLLALSLGGQAAGTIASALRPRMKPRFLSPEGLRGVASARLSTQNALTQSNIKQAGAAGRLPSGAITSALAKAKAPTYDPNLDAAVTDINRFNINQQNLADVASQQRFDDLLNFNLEGLGTLSKIALLSKYGYLNRDRGAYGGFGIGGDAGDLSAIYPDELQGYLAG